MVLYQLIRHCVMDHALYLCIYFEAIIQCVSYICYPHAQMLCTSIMKHMLAYIIDLQINEIDMHYS